MKFTLLVPTLNEVEGMKAVMPRIRREWVDEILIVDGGSTDGTLEYAEACGYPILRQKEPGLPAGYREAMEQIDSEVVITFSPDGNSVPENIPRLVEKMKEGYDMVIASRYLAGAKSEDDDIVTAFGNWMFTTMINLLFGGRYTDSLVIFRAWRADLYRSSSVDVTTREGLEPFLSIKCAHEKLKVAEIPGDEPKRIGGIRKMNPLLNGWGCLTLILRERLRRLNPQSKSRLSHI